MGCCQARALSRCRGRLFSSWPCACHTSDVDKLGWLSGPASMLQGYVLKLALRPASRETQHHILMPLAASGSMYKPPQPSDALMPTVA